MKYVITIVDKINNNVHLLEKNEENIDKTVIKELGGWDNLHASSTGGGQRDLLHRNEYFMAGITKDKLKAFSILCVIN